MSKPPMINATNDLCETFGWVIAWPIEIILTRRWLSFEAFLTGNGWVALGGGWYRRQG